MESFKMLNVRVVVVTAVNHPDDPLAHRNLSAVIVQFISTVSVVQSSIFEFFVKNQLKPRDGCNNNKIIT